MCFIMMNYLLLKTLFVLTLSAAVTGQILHHDGEARGENLIENVLESVHPKKRKEILHAFETSLLSLFSLKSRPRPSKDLKIPQYLIDLYQSYTDDPNGMAPIFNVKGKTIGPANTVRSFYHNDEKEELVQMTQCGNENCVKMWFNVTNIPSEEVLTAAEFRMFVDRDDSALDIDTKRKRRFRVEMHEVMKPARDDRESITRLIDVKHLNSLKNGTWTSFDVHPAVLKWKKSPHLNHGLEVRILPYNNHPSNNLPIKHVRLRRSASEESELEWHSKRPILVTYTDDTRQGRTKRNASNNTKQSKRKRRRNRNKNRKSKHRRRRVKKSCKRKPLYVDFAAVGWNDWIYAPPGYLAYYCQGECEFPYPEHLNVTNHAIVQDLVNSIDPKSVPKPCCVPTDLSPVPLLYVDEYQQVILKSYQNMRVEGCGCR